MKNTCILAILDGWGIGKKDESNPIYMAKTPCLHSIEERFPAVALTASGISVGMPWDAAGTSEVGHLTIGAGRVVYQNHPKISLAIRDGSFFENAALAKAFASKGTVHLVGLYSDSTEYAAKEHVFALLEMAAKKGVKNLRIHLILDAPENSPRNGRALAAELFSKMKPIGYENIASVSGIFFAIPRDRSEEKIRRAADAISGTGMETAESLASLFEEAEEKKASGELLTPKKIGSGTQIVPGDEVIFWNFEEEGLKGLVEEIQKIEGIGVTTLADYGIPGTSPAFQKDGVTETLGGAIAKAGKNQMRIAETEKYRNITFYLNGMREKPYENEYRAEIPSKTGNIIANPEMMAEAVTERVILSLEDRGFDFIACTYANPDILAKTGDFEATVRAVQVLDRQIEKIMNLALKEGHTLIITSGHGNAESLMNPETGEPDRGNNPNPVPFYLVGQRFAKRNPGNPGKLETAGMLADVAPTILELMGVPKPAEMTGESLLGQLI